VLKVFNLAVFSPHKALNHSLFLVYLSLLFVLFPLLLHQLRFLLQVFFFLVAFSSEECFILFYKDYIVALKQHLQALGIFLLVWFELIAKFQHGVIESLHVSGQSSMHWYREEPLFDLMTQEAIYVFKSFDVAAC